MTSEKLKYIETLAIELYKGNPGISNLKVLKAIALDLKAGFDPDQARDESGKWGDGSPDVEKDLEKEYPDLTIDIYQDDKRGVLTLSRVVVPEDKRGEGLGSRFMESLTTQADKMGYSIILTPSGDFGGDVDRLKEFYQRYGFIFNKGEDRDFSHREDMYRLPQKTKAGFDPNQPRDRSGQWGDQGVNPFKESKVKNKVYHGTKSEFNEFSADEIGKDNDFGQLGRGFYFTDEYQNALNYANNATGIADPVVKEVFLNLKNPYLWESGVNSTSMLSLNEAQKITDDLISKGFDGVEYKTDWGQTWYVAFEPDQIKIID